MSSENASRSKVLFVSPLPSYSIGGISRWTEHILTYHAKQTDSHYDIVQYYGEKTDAKGNLGNNIIQRFVRGIGTFYPLYKGCVSRMRRSHFDIVHICSSASVSLIKDILILKAAKRLGIKSVIHFHFGRIPDIFKNKNWEYHLLHKVLTLADKVIVLDEKSYGVLKENGYKNIVILPNPLTPAVVDIINENKNLQREENTLVFAGYVVPNKGVFELVEACKQLKNIKLKILGKVTDEAKSEVLQHAGPDSENWLKIYGEQDFDFTIKSMLTAEIFVLPTYREGFPNVIIESMACGCAIVTTDVGAIPEMLDLVHGEHYGVCVKPRDVAGLRQALEKMLNNKAYARSCGENAQKRVRDMYAMPVVYNKLISIWNSI